MPDTYTEVEHPNSIPMDGIDTLIHIDKPIPVYPIPLDTHKPNNSPIISYNNHDLKHPIILLLSNSSSVPCVEPVKPFDLLYTNSLLLTKSSYMGNILKAKDVTYVEYHNPECHPNKYDKCFYRNLQPRTIAKRKSIGTTTVKVTTTPSFHSILNLFHPPPKHCKDGGMGRDPKHGNNPKRELHDFIYGSENISINNSQQPSQNHPPNIHHHRHPVQIPPPSFWSDTGIS
jgi:hypothetical protein